MTFFLLVCCVQNTSTDQLLPGWGRVTGEQEVEPIPPINETPSTDGIIMSRTGRWNGAQTAMRHNELSF